MRIDSARLRGVVRSNIEALCRHFFPAGKKEGSEWRIADVSGARGESLRICLSPDKAGLWKDWATGDKGSFVQLLMRSRGLTFPEAAAEIGRFLGFDLEDHEHKHYSKNGASPIDWASCRKLSVEDEKRLAAWRAFSAEFVRWLVDHELIRTCGTNGDASWVFPIHLNGKVAGTHSRPIEWSGPDGCPWTVHPTKKQNGPGIQPLVIGDLDSAKVAHLSESTWDVLALCDKLRLHETDGFVALSTRSASNRNLAKALPDSIREVYLWPQNDEPGRKWAEGVKPNLPPKAITKIVPTPAQHADLNDWTRAGATADDLLQAIKSAQSPDGLPSISNLSEITDADLVEKPEVITDVLRRGSKLVLGSTSKGRKTWTLINLAMAVATGTKWLGFATNPGRVLYVNFELHDATFKKRTQWVARDMGADGKTKNFDVWTLRGHAASFDAIVPKIIARAKEVGYALIVLDPSYKMLGNLDENKAGDITRLMNELERLAFETGGAVAFAAHFAKGAQDNKASIDRISGSGVYARDPDCIITMTPHEEEGALSVELTLRDFKPVEPFVVKLVGDVFQRVDGLDPKALQKGLGRPPKFSADDLLRSLGDDELTDKEWRDRCKEDNGFGNTTYYELRKKLEFGNRVFKSPVSGKWARAQKESVAV